MIRRAFTMRLKPGALAEYKRHHDNIWPELVREIEKSGIARFFTFERDPDLFLFSEIDDPDAWDKLWGSEVHRRWGEIMERLMHFKDGKVDSGELREIFRCEPAKRRKSPKPQAKKTAHKKTSKKKAGGKKPKRRR